MAQQSDSGSNYTKAQKKQERQQRRAQLQSSRHYQQVSKREVSEDALKTRINSINIPPTSNAMYGISSQFDHCTDINAMQGNELFMKAQSSLTATFNPQNNSNLLDKFQQFIQSNQTAQAANVLSQIVPNAPDNFTLEKNAQDKQYKQMVEQQTQADKASNVGKHADFSDANRYGWMSND